MKNGFLKLAFVASLAMILVLPGCKKDDEFTLGKCVPNTSWLVRSFTENGKELKGVNADFNSIELEFKEYNKASQTGNFLWKLTNNNGATQYWEGNYKLIEPKEIELNFTSPFVGSAIFNITCTKSEINLDGNLGGFKWIIQADI